MSELKLEVGKKYLTLSNTVVEIIYQVAPDVFGHRYIGMHLSDGALITSSYREDGCAGRAGGPLHPESIKAEYHEWHDIKVHEPVMVRNSDAREWLPRYFAGVKNGLPHAWRNGASSWANKDSIHWKQCRRPTEEELNRAN